MNNKEYLVNRNNRLKEYFRVRLGVFQLINKPLLNALLVPILAITIIIWGKKDELLILMNVPRIMFPVLQYVLIFLAIMIPILLVTGVLGAIGNYTAQKDEADLEEAFNSQDLRNGCPILVFRKRIKGTEVTVREFHSSIPLKTWIDKMDSIADSMNISFVEKVSYGRSNGKRIVIHSVPGREIKSRGNLYDEEF